MYLALAVKGWLAAISKVFTVPSTIYFKAENPFSLAAYENDKRAVRIISPLKIIIVDLSIRDRCAVKTAPFVGSVEGVVGSAHETY